MRATARTTCSTIAAATRPRGSSPCAASPATLSPASPRFSANATKSAARVLRHSRRFFNIGIYQFKLSLYRDLAKDNPEEKGYISFPRGLPDSYFEELVCERRVPYKRMGVTAFRWEKPDRQANEMHDCFLYASAAAIKYGVNWISDQGWARLRAELETPAVSSSLQAQGDGVRRINKAKSIASMLAR